MKALARWLKGSLLNRSNTQCSKSIPPLLSVRSMQTCSTAIDKSKLAPKSHLSCVPQPWALSAVSSVSIWSLDCHARRHFEAGERASELDLRNKAAAAEIVLRHQASQSCDSMLKSGSPSFCLFNHYHHFLVSVVSICAFGVVPSPSKPLSYTG